MRAGTITAKTYPVSATPDNTQAMARRRNVLRRGFGRRGQPGEAGVPVTDWGLSCGAGTVRGAMTPETAGRYPRTGDGGP